LLKRRHTSSAVLVIGLGRFGSAVASSLIRQGREVLAVDTDPLLVQRYADEFTYVVQADATDDEVLEQLGVRDF
jgi:trk system potassium uptake protein TrkA